MSQDKLFHLRDWDSGAHEFETQDYQRMPRAMLGGRLPRAMTGVNSAPSQAASDRFQGYESELLKATQRKGSYIPLYGTVGTSPVLVRPAESRIYLIIQNTSVANQLIVGVGFQPVNNGTSVAGLILAANGGNFEPAVIPQQEIWLLGSGAGTGYTIFVAQG